MAIFKNRYWSFKIEQKFFVLRLLKDKGGVRTSEETDLEASRWLLMSLLQFGG